MENVMTGTQQGQINITSACEGVDQSKSVVTPVTQNSCRLREEKRDYSGLESVYAWISLALGYLFCKVFPVWVNPLGGVLFVLVLYGVSIPLLKMNGACFGKNTIAAIVSGVLVACSLVMNSREIMELFAFSYSIMTYCYVVFVSLENETQKGFSDYIVVDYFKALIIAPFKNIGSLFKALFEGKAKKGSDVLKKVILGIFIAMIPTIIVANLLSFDEGFTKIISNFLNFGIDDVFSEMFTMIFGVLVGMYVFELFVVSKDKECKEYSLIECEEKVANMKKAHFATVISAVLPIFVLYVIFFISQWKYFMYGFSGKLPEGFSYASYAREGFFQLCKVSVINLIIIVSVIICMQQKEKWTVKLKSIIVVIYALVTLVLIATAIAKMAMYINCYGLTQKRVYSTWFMVLLAMIFVIIIVKQFVKKISAVALSVWVTIGMFTVLAFSNVEGFIARYNINQYLSGEMENLDMEALDKLGDAAVPEVVYLIEELDKSDETNGILKPNTVYSDMQLFLEEAALEYNNEPREIMGYTLPYYKAIAALENAGFMEFE